MFISDLQTVLNRNIGNLLTLEMASGILTSMAQIQGQREQQQGQREQQDAAAVAATQSLARAPRRRTPAEVK